mmetsp:Transcript_228/g.530  ORF Transcript_228/g.530 Transcript_228/m.530 type:complete len:544 (+) Transcript_228:211-1842(+)
MVDQRSNGRSSFGAFGAYDAYDAYYIVAHVKQHRRRRLQHRIMIAFSLFLSLLSYAICFPFGDGMTTKLKPRATSEMNRRQTYHRSCPLQPSRSSYSQELLVLILSSTSTSLSSKSNFSRTTTSKTKEKKRKSTNIITIEAVDRAENELPFRTCEYRRRKHEWAERYTSQEGLREAFGRNRNRLWGDLDAKTARRLYKTLLFPTAISELVLELGDEIVRPEELAPLAYEARKAAKMYVRERCRVPSRVGAYLYDGFRQFRKYGKFQPNGASYEQLWIRYYQENGSSRNSTEEEFKLLIGQDESQVEEIDTSDNLGGNIIDDIDDAVTEEEIVKLTCQKILEKSCTTNAAIDRLFLKDYQSNKSEDDGTCLEVNSDSDDTDEDEYILRGRKGCGKRWRNRKKRKDRYNDLWLEEITKTLERDVRKLLDPPPSSICSSMDHGGGRHLYRDSREEIEECIQQTNEFGNSKTSMIEGDWSSRRMTRQEYHSLKLFAKARKHSQLHDREVNTNVIMKRAARGDGALKNATSDDRSVSEAKTANRESIQ